MPRILGGMQEWSQSDSRLFQLPEYRKAEHACAQPGTFLRLVTLHALCTLQILSTGFIAWEAGLHYIVLQLLSDFWLGCVGAARNAVERPRRLLRLPGRSLIRVPLPGASANSSQQRAGSKPSLSELGTTRLSPDVVPSDASSDLLNWEKADWVLGGGQPEEQR